MTLMSSARAAQVLLVEDNPSDVRLTQEAILESSFAPALSVVRDGAAALEFLHRQGRYTTAPRPDLILLDLNLPRKNGREVLGAIKQDPDLRAIPVIVMSTSAAQEDVQESYRLHANCYITKPVDLDGFIEAIRQIESFWLQLVKLPESY